MGLTMSPGGCHRSRKDGKIKKFSGPALESLTQVLPQTTLVFFRIVIFFFLAGRLEKVSCGSRTIEVLHINNIRKLWAALGPEPNHPPKMIMAIARGYVDVLDLDVTLSDLAQASP